MGNQILSCFLKKSGGVCSFSHQKSLLPQWRETYWEKGGEIKIFNLPRFSFSSFPLPKSNQDLIFFFLSRFLLRIEDSTRDKIVSKRKFLASVKVEVLFRSTTRWKNLFYNNWGLSWPSRKTKTKKQYCQRTKKSPPKASQNDREFEVERAKLCAKMALDKKKLFRKNHRFWCPLLKFREPRRRIEEEATDAYFPQQTYDLPRLVVWKSGKYVFGTSKKNARGREACAVKKQERDPFTDLRRGQSIFDKSMNHDVYSFLPVHTNLRQSFCLFPRLLRQRFCLFTPLLKKSFCFFSPLLRPSFCLFTPQKTVHGNLKNGSLPQQTQQEQSFALPEM